MSSRTSAAKKSRELLILLAAFLDGVVVVSGVPVMMAQAAHVSFPSGLYLLMYQMCYFLPQLVTTLLTERVAQYVSSLVLLFLTLMASALSAFTLSYSLETGLLVFFFLSRVISGIFRHEKLIFGLVTKSLNMQDGAAAVAGRNGMICGFLLSGIAGDTLKNAVLIAKLFTCVQCFAAVLVFCRVLQGGEVKRPVPQERLEYMNWLSTLLSSPPAARQAFLVFGSAMLAATVNQVVYPLLPPRYGLSYTFTGAHLAFNVFFQIYGVAYAEKLFTAVGGVISKLLLGHGTPHTIAANLAALLLLIGCSVVPHLAAADTLALFYVASFTLIDVPALILNKFMRESITTAMPRRTSSAMLGMLILHLTQILKMVGAPFRICLAEMLIGHKDPVRYISIPLAVFTIFALNTTGVRWSCIAFLATIAFFTASPFSTEGDL